MEIINTALCLGALLSHGTTLYFRRYLILRPSFQIALLYCVFIQFPMAVLWADVVAFLPRPIEFAVLIHGFVIVTLAISLILNERRSERIFSATAAVGRFPELPRKHERLLVLIALLVGFWYFSKVPIETTGLYAIMFEPERAAMARESSLKLLDDQALKYAFSMNVSVILPVLAVSYYFRLLNTLAFNKRRRLVWVTGLLCWTSVLGLIFAFASVTGARSFPAVLVVAMAYAHWIRRGAALSIFGAVTVATLVLTPITVLTILRESQDLQLQVVADYFVRATLWRLFEAPLETGLFYAVHQQTTGGFGVAALPKIASLLGYTPVDAPNYLGLTFQVTDVLDTVSANAGFVMAYYGYFGIAALPVSVALALTLDALIMVVSRNVPLAIFLCPVILVAIIGLVSYEFLTAIVTGGLIYVLVLALMREKEGTKLQVLGGTRPAR